MEKYGQNGDNEYQQQFQGRGIRFSYILDEFIPNNGDVEAFRGLTTQQVKVKYILPLTASKSESYLTYIRRTQHHKMSDASGDGDTAPSLSSDGTTHQHPLEGGSDESLSSAFISHAHSYQFLDTIDAIRYHLLLEDDLSLDSYVFMDIFCINQHRTDWSYEFLSKTFMEIVELFGRTIVVMSPWNDPIPFTRAWCIYEAYCTSITQTRYDIALSSKERRNFLHSMKENNATSEINSLLSTINAEQSTASFPEEQRRIHSVIRDSIGFDTLNSLVLEQYRGWVIETTLVALFQYSHSPTTNSTSPTTVPVEEIWNLHDVVGTLYRDQGNYAEAQEYLQSALEIAKASFGVDSEKYNFSTNNLANLYIRQGDFDSGKVLHKECLETRRRLLGPTHPNTLASMNNLGLLYVRQEKYNCAEPLLVECFENTKSHFGANHSNTLVTMYNLATFYSHSGRHELAENLYTDCYEKRILTLGETHPHTLESMNGLARAYYLEGKKLDLAERLYKDCFQKRKVLLGPDHPQTLTSMEHLAKSYALREKYDLAIPLLQDCAKQLTSTLGVNHPDTRRVLHDLKVCLQCHHQINQVTNWKRN